MKYTICKVDDFQGLSKDTTGVCLKIAPGAWKVEVEMERELDGVPIIAIDEEGRVYGGAWEFLKEVEGEK